MKGKRIFFKGSIFCVLALSLILLPTISFSATFCVGDEAELQAALTTAASNAENDVIQIVQGIHVGNFIYSSTESNSLIIEGGYTPGCASRVEDPSNTVLDGNGTGTVLVLANNLAADVVVEGLALENGVASNGKGGGVYSYGSTVTLTNNVITQNSASNFGGGVYSYGGTVTLTNNVITQNSASRGGGVFIEDCTTIIMTNNEITQNSGEMGGGAYFEYSCTTVTLTDNMVLGNQAHGSLYGVGGGINFHGGTVTLTNNVITQNSASNFGGGISTQYGSTVTLTNNVITQNSASSFGGGASVQSTTTITLTNNVITQNSASWGGGLRLGVGKAAHIYNNIIWQNTGPEGTDLYIQNDEDDNFIPSPVYLFNNDFNQSSSGTYMAIPFTIDPTNLDNEDPLFVGSGDYHLTASSPCINSGDNDAPDLPATDKDGNPRIFGGTVDMGAYEFQPIVYIAPDGLCDGHTPCYSKIQDGIDWDGFVFTIKAEQGTYGEDIIFDEPKEIIFKGGWDSTFASPSGETETNSMTISDGTVVLDEGCLAIGE
ncbi:MAG: right-handed parallel beta-helix repeat-containing protein [Desulfobacteraceae bacterium]|nr:right-handed parallel beta-helix repeat-containing protein [Desulfobacteraceae bacterium]